MTLKRHLTHTSGKYSIIKNSSDQPQKKSTTHILRPNFLHLPYPTKPAYSPTCLLAPTQSQNLPTPSSSTDPKANGTKPVLHDQAPTTQPVLAPDLAHGASWRVYQRTCKSRSGPLPPPPAAIPRTHSAPFEPQALVALTTIHDPVPIGNQAIVTPPAIMAVRVLCSWFATSPQVRNSFDGQQPHPHVVTVPLSHRLVSLLVNPLATPLVMKNPG